MKNYLAILIIIAWMPYQAYAEGSWWDKGVDFFKILSESIEKGAITAPDNFEIEKAFKQALNIGTENVVSQLSSMDGFNNDPSIHIPLPKELDKIKQVLSMVGMSQLVDDLELKLNRAAELATHEIKNIFLQAITEMAFEDIKNIYEGPEDSATKYFQSKMSPHLKKAMQPIVENTLAEVGAIQAYENIIGQYKSLPFVPNIKANLENHVVQKGMEGIFFYIAKEEASIRSDPVKQTTKLLKKVFGVK